MSDFFSWVRAIWTTSRGQSLDFINRKYLVDIYKDQYPEIVIMKSSQMGLTERLLAEAVWITDQLGLNVLYTFPAQKQLQELVQARLNPVLAMSDYLSSRIRDEELDLKKTETLSLKRIGKGHIYFRGSQNAKQIITVDADCVILDERDTFNEDNVPYIDKRLGASTLKWRREISTPTIPGYRIHSSYLQSDQRVWQVPCSRCGKWQELDFFKSIDFRRKKVRCIKCKKTIKRFVHGRWFAKNPKSKIHGYKVNGLYNPTLEIGDIVIKYRDAKRRGISALEQFFNQDLGLPYEAEGQKIQVSELDACKRDYMVPFEKADNCFAGIDVGSGGNHHVVILQRRPDEKMRLIWAGMVNKFLGPRDSIEQAILNYNVRVAVIDKKPETTKVTELIEKFPKRKIYAVYYPSTKFSIQEYCFWDDVKSELKLDRTISIDYLISDIQNQRLELPMNVGMIPNFYRQLQGAQRRTKTNERTGVDEAFWIKIGEDHYLHALNFARMAISRGVIGKALLDYYQQPEEGLTPSFVDWVRINGKRVF